MGLGLGDALVTQLDWAGDALVTRIIRDGAAIAIYLFLGAYVAACILSAILYGTRQSRSPQAGSYRSRSNWHSRTSTPLRRPRRIKSKRDESLERATSAESGVDIDISNFVWTFMSASVA